MRVSGLGLEQVMGCRACGKKSDVGLYKDC